MVKHEPQVTRRGVLDMQVCVPTRWTNAQIVDFANANNPCGTIAGWHVRKDRELLRGDPIRRQCEGRKGYIHVMLDA